MNTYLYYVRIKATYLSYAIIYEYTTWEEHTYVVIYIHWHKDTHSSYLLTNWDAPPTNGDTRRQYVTSTQMNDPGPW